MSRGNFQLPPIGSETETEIVDAEGQSLASFPAVEEIVAGPNNTRRLRRHHQSMITSDGFSWHPGLLSSKTPIYVGQCALCRHPSWRFPFRKRPTSGLVTMLGAAYCRRCGVLVCPQHRREVEGNPLCIRCNRRRKLWRLVDLFFFSQSQGT